MTKHTKIHSFTRPAFPSPVAPGWNGNASASLWASHPAVTHDARQSRDSPTDTGPDHTLINRPPNGATTHNVRPHVARRVGPAGFSAGPPSELPVRLSPQAAQASRVGGSGLLLRRLEDPLPQPPYVVLVQPPIDGFPLAHHVLGSVHHQVSNLPLGSGGSDRIASKTHLSTSAPSSRARARGTVSGQLSIVRPLGGAVIRSWFPVGFRPPALAFWTSCSRRRLPLSLRSAYRSATRRPGLRRVFRVPHA